MPNVILWSPCEQFPLVTFPCPKCSDQNMQASLSPMDSTCGQASPHRLPRLIYCLNMKSSLAENMRVILGWEQAPTTLFQPKKWQKLLLVLVKLFPLSSRKLMIALFQSWSKVLHETEQRVVFYTNLDSRKAHMLPKCEKQQWHKIIYGLAFSHRCKRRPMQGRWCLD